MTSTTSSDWLLEVDNLKVHFELEHFKYESVRDVFITALTHPIEYFFKQKEMLKALDGVSFKLKKGTKLGIIGLNGSGKTTLCRCLAGMIHPQEGTIHTRAEVRAIFDTGTGIMPELTGRENAELLARLFFPKHKNHKELVNEVVEFSELGHFIDVPFRQYSKGMQSRLMLSLISSQTPDILILDEVFEGADIVFQKKLQTRMKNIIDEAGATIFVSHSLDHIKDVCNLILVLHKGKMVYIGHPEVAMEHFYRTTGIEY